MGIFKHFGQSGMGYPVKVEKTGTGLWKSDSVSEIVFLERLREHNLIKVNLIPIFNLMDQLPTHDSFVRRMLSDRKICESYLRRFLPR